MEVAWNNEENWRFTAVYGSPHVRARRELWRELRNLANIVNRAWCLGGDFNSTLSVADAGDLSKLICR